MTVNFYTVPVDMGHRNVIYKMRDYLATKLTPLTRDIQQIVPKLGEDFVVETTSFGVETPSYCTFTWNGVEFGCFVNVEYVTPLTVRCVLRADWWYMFMDYVSTQSPRNVIRLTGQLVESTMYRNGSSLHGACNSEYVEKAVYAMSAINTETVFTAFSVAVTITMTETQTEAVSSNPRLQYTATLIMDYTGDVAQIGSLVKILPYYKQFHVERGEFTGDFYISGIQSVQILPTGLGILADQQASHWGYLVHPNNAFTDIYAEFYLPEMPDTFPSGRYVDITVPANKADEVYILGNFSRQIMFADNNVSRTVRLRAAFGGTNIKVTCFCDGKCEDVSDAFTLPVSFTNAKAIADQNKVSNAITLAGAGLSLAGAVGSAVASGGATAAVLPSAILGGVSALAGVRNRPVAANAVTSSVGWWHNLSWCGMFCPIRIPVLNGNARKRSSVLHGYAGDAIFYDVDLPDTFAQMPSDNGYNNSVYEYVRYSDGLQIDAYTIGAGRIRPTIDIVEDIRATLTRGMSIWSNEIFAQSWGTLIGLRGQNA